MSTDYKLPLPIHEFLKDYFTSEAFQTYQLAGDASARKYYRIIFNAETFVLMAWEPFVVEKYPFLNILRHLEKTGVNVPAVKAVGADLGIILLEDLGDLTLERKFWEATQTAQSWPFYEKALDQIITIHTQSTESKEATIAKEIQFDTAKFLWEMNYAKEHLIQGLLKYNLTPQVASQLDNVFTAFCERLHQEPKVICHRDYHSRNLMIKLDKVIVIDFQDARLGPIQYDLVSLIKDSYVDISDEYAEQMLRYYLDHTDFLKKFKMTREYFDQIFELQSVQRCFKASGSFASFMNTRSDTRYLKYLKPTLQKVKKSLNHFPEYKLLLDVLNDSGALENSYEKF